MDRLRAGRQALFARHADVVVVMLCGGDKSSQKRDIQAAKAKEL